MKRALTIICLVLTPFLALSQKKCLTPSGISPWLQTFQQHPERFADLRSSTGWSVPVTVHITEDGSGSPAIPVNQMLDAFCQLNSDFSPTNIQFYIDQIRFLDRPDYYDHANINTAVDMITRNRVQGTVNVFFVNTAVEQGVCGYNLVDQNVVSYGMTLAGDCTSGANSNWAHEMGHYLSLPHTFNGWEGIQHDYREPAPERVNNVLVERLDQRNCQESGDGFCDTPPDYLNGRWYCAEDGSSSFVQRDPDDNAFRSDGSMIMSYAFDGCADRFSPRQISAMQNFLVSRRSDHLPMPPEFRQIRPNDINLTYPANADTIGAGDIISLEWERVEGAMGYVLEVSLLPTFAVLERQVFVFTNNHSVRDLRANRTYYWRVRPFSGRYTCAVYSGTRSFTTRNLTTGIPSLSAVDAFSLQPNPLQEGQSLQVAIQGTSATTLKLEVRALSGQILWQGQQRILPGAQTWQIPTGQLSKGLYLLRLQDASGALAKKFVVQ